MATYAYIHVYPGNPMTLAAFKDRIKEYHLRPENILYDEGDKRYYYKLLLSKLRTGDLVIIDSVFSFGKTERLIVGMWEELRNKHHVNIKVLSLPYLDTQLKGIDIPEGQVADLAMEVIGGILDEMKEMRKRKKKDPE